MDQQARRKKILSTRSSNILKLNTIYVVTWRETHMTTKF
uniref:Uncharacterized protein n=1 Tax=Rhizophora mucronata TaxID=61149 RepID=A0A2P2KES1_RHIMU